MPTRIHQLRQKICVKSFGFLGLLVHELYPNDQNYFLTQNRYPSMLHHHPPTLIFLIASFTKV